MNLQKSIKNGNESVVTISYKIKFIDNARFKANSLSNLVDNLTEGIYNTKCKHCDCVLEYESVKDYLIKCKCLSCNKDYSNKIDEKFKKRFKNKFIFSNNDTNKLILLLRKCVYLCGYTDEWEKFSETLLPEEDKFYGNLNMEDIVNFFSAAPGLEWQAALKKTELKSELLTDIDMLLMVEKGIRGRISHSIH